MNPQDNTMSEKVEALFNLRVSSSGADMSISFSTDRIWIKGDEWIELRQNIEALIANERAIWEKEFHDKHYLGPTIVDGGWQYAYDEPVYKHVIELKPLTKDIKGDN